MALPDSLFSALRAGVLDDPGVLCEYPKLSVEDLVVVLGETLGEDAAPLGAASSWTTGTTMPSEVTVSLRISSGISAATVPEASSVDGSVVSGSVLFSAAWGAGSHSRRFTLSTYGTYTHCVSRVPVHAVSQPSPFNLCVPRTRAPSSSPVVSLLVSSLSCSPLRRFERTRVHGFFCAWTSGTCLASSCWMKGYGDGADFEGFLVSPFAYGFGADGFSVFLFFCFPLFVFLYSPRKGGLATPTATPVSLFVCCGTRRLQRVQLFLRSFELYRPWIPGEHRRGICAVECTSAHLRGFEEDSRPEVVFWIDELSMEFGCHWFIVEEHVLFSVLQHIFAGSKRTRDQKMSSGLKSGQLNLSSLFQRRGTCAAECVAAHLCGCEQQ